MRAMAVLIEGGEKTELDTKVERGEEGGGGDC